MIKIRIIGCGCDLCERLEKNVISAAKQAGVQYEFQKVCDYETKMTPILFVDNKILCTGKAISVEEIKEMIVSLSQQRR
jgi:hypothetical protein